MTVGEIPDVVFLTALQDEQEARRDQLLGAHLYAAASEYYEFHLPMVNRCSVEARVAFRMPSLDPSSGLLLLKAKQLIRRHLIVGCACGCRGDYEITPKGQEFLERAS